MSRHHIPRTRLKEIRLKMGLTQKQLGEELGVSMFHYSQLERGETNPSLKTIKKMIEIMKLSAKDILTF